jgi:hypothetical protein
MAGLRRGGDRNTTDFETLLVADYRELPQFVKMIYSFGPFRQGLW